MPPTVIEYNSHRNHVRRWPRLQIGLLLGASLLSILFACNSGWRAVEQWSAIAQGFGGGSGCATCDEQIRSRLSMKKASFSNHLSILVFTSGVALVCVVGAVRNYNALPAKRPDE
jgi:hypothetical protein